MWLRSHSYKIQFWWDHSFNVKMQFPTDWVQKEWLLKSCCTYLISMSIYVMQRARAPATSIKTKGFIRGRKMLLNPGMIPQILQESRKSTCQLIDHHYFKTQKSYTHYFSIWLQIHLPVTANDASENCNGPSISAQSFLIVRCQQKLIKFRSTSHSLTHQELIITSSILFALSPSSHLQDVFLD